MICDVLEVALAEKTMGSLYGISVLIGKMVARIYYRCVAVFMQVEIFRNSMFHVF